MVLGVSIDSDGSVVLSMNRLLFVRQQKRIMTRVDDYRDNEDAL